MCRALADRDLTLYEGELPHLRTVDHRLDVWHKGNALYNRLHTLGSSKSQFQNLLRWCLPLRNHFWWACRMCEGDSFVFKVCTLDAYMSTISDKNFVILCCDNVL